MRALILIATLAACSGAWADVTLPNNLEENSVASATDVMDNFNALKDGVDENASAVEANAAAINAVATPPTDCTTDQVIKWDGSAWQCSYPLTATFYSDDWDRDGEWDSGTNVYTFEMFSPSARGVMSGAEGPYRCEKSWRCTVGVAGVANHLGCSISESGNSGHISAPIAQFPDMWCDTWACFFLANSLVKNEPVTITVTCPD